MNFNIDSEKRVAEIEGELTFTDHSSFKQLVSTLFEGNVSPIVLDLSKLEFIDSAGLGMLLLVRDEVNKSAKKLILRGPRGQVKRMFAVTKFETLFAVEE